MRTRARWLHSLGPSRGCVVRLPPRTVRLRLTLLYGGMFLISGAVLLAITYLLVRHSTGSLFLVRADAPHAPVRLRPGAAPPGTIPTIAQQARAQALHQHAAELHQLLVQSGIALAIMSVASVALGWLLAGRVLRPLRTITQTTQQISEHNLHHRLALGGPRDELRDLANTIDGLLGRLESAFGAQRHFVANAAHELRTPLTLLRALLEENLTDPAATIESFRAMSRRLLQIGEDQERLLEALLTLASSERGLDRQEPFDLSVIVDQLLLARNADAERIGIRINTSISSAPTAGDPALAERLLANLIDNAIRHNRPGGHVEVATGTEHSRAWLVVTNSGPRIPANEVERLFEPFQRPGTGRTTRNNGHHGLGLSIVRAIANAHHARLTAEPGPDGGLAIEVSFARHDEAAFRLTDTIAAGAGAHA
jgi:signal transduction histidine kinase